MQIDPPRKTHIVYFLLILIALAIGLDCYLTEKEKSDFEIKTQKHLNEIRKQREAERNRIVPEV